LASVLLLVVPFGSKTAFPGGHGFGFQWFEENLGREDSGVAFIGRGFPVPVRVLSNGVLVLGPKGAEAELRPIVPDVANRTVVVKVTGRQTGAGGPRREFAHSDASAVHCAGLWPDTDLYYRVRDGSLELGMDFPMGPPAQMPALEWRAARAHIDPEGQIVVQARDWSFLLRRPWAYQPAPERGIYQLPVQYDLSRGVRLSFVIAGATPGLPLTIDPVLEFPVLLDVSRNGTINGKSSAAAKQRSQRENARPAKRLLVSDDDAVIWQTRLR
jgi:hypothetical protein